MKLRIARSAVADLDEIWGYVASSQSIEAAERLVNLLASRFSAIAGHPGLGRSRAELGEGIRSLVAGNYRIYYRQERKSNCACALH
jgi:plasmid stabilization system protein ParE